MAIARICWLPSLLLLGSCTMLQPVMAPPDLQPIPQGELSRLNGCYAATGPGTSNLGSILLPGNDKTAAFGKQEVHIQALDNRHLQLRLVDELGLVRERVCEVRVQAGYCELAKYRHYFSQFVIVNGYESSVARISLLQNGNLTVDAANGGIHVVLILPVIFPESFQRSSHLEFRRIGD